MLSLPSPRPAVTGEDLGGRVIESSLPGRATSMIAMVRGEMWLIIDPDKPHAAGHASLLLDHYTR